MLEMEVACLGTSWPPGCNCLFGQLRTQLQLNHKIRRKPLSQVAHSRFPPVPWQGWRVGLCWAGWGWGKSIAALVSTLFYEISQVYRTKHCWSPLVLGTGWEWGVLGRALSFYIRGPKTCGVPGGECETTGIDCKISNGWTILPSPEICLKPSSFLPPTKIWVNSQGPASTPTSPIPNFSFNPYLSGLPGASTTWRSSWVDKESVCLQFLKLKRLPQQKRPEAQDFNSL